MLMCIENLVKFCPLVLKILSGNKNYDRMTEGQKDRQGKSSIAPTPKVVTFLPSQHDVTGQPVGGLGPTNLSPFFSTLWFKSKQYAKIRKAIRTQNQPSKSKREITTITNSHYTKRKYGQPSKQLFPKRWPLSNRKRTRII